MKKVKILVATGLFLTLAGCQAPQNNAQPPKEVDEMKTEDKKNSTPTVTDDQSQAVTDDQSQAVTDDQSQAEYEQFVGRKALEGIDVDVDTSRYEYDLGLSPTDSAEDIQRKGDAYIDDVMKDIYEINGWN